MWISGGYISPEGLYLQYYPKSDYFVEEQYIF